MNGYARARLWRCAGARTPFLILVLSASLVRAATLTFQEGQNGYSGCKDTYLSESAPNTAFGLSTAFEWDADEPAGTGQATIALIRFDGLFGSEPGQIPPAAQITSATLTYTVFASGDSAAIHEALVDWSESTSYNAFGGSPGVQVTELGERIATAPGGGTTQSVNVTCSVARWAADPSANRGWVLLPVGPDGVDVRSSEYSGVFAQRPKLTVLIDEGPPAVGLVRQPYLQSGTPTGMTVVWRTDVCTSTLVRFGSAADNLDQETAIAESTVDHVVTLSGLTPGTRYYYAVGFPGRLLAGGDAEHYFDTSPQQGSANRFTAWIVGDSGFGTQPQFSVRDAMLTATGAYPPDLFVHVGDIAYYNGTDFEFTTRFFAPYAEILRHTVFWPALGNHEGASSASATQSGPYYESYVLPTGGEAGGVPSGTEAYYSFDYANAHFICLDSHHSDRTPGSPMLQWLAEDLASTEQEWLIAFWHHPPYSKGTHDSDSIADSGGRMRDMRENVLPLLEVAGVDLVLSGHSHGYERSYLVDGAYDTPTTAEGHVVDPGDGAETGNGAYLKPPGLNSHLGAVYVVAGHGGAPLGALGSHPLMHYHEVGYGSCLLNVVGHALALQNIRADGLASDQFALMKGTPSNDYNGDWVIGSDDYFRLMDCLAGPGTPPSPSPPATEARCVAVFDTDVDGDVDLADYGRFIPSPLCTPDLDMDADLDLQDYEQWANCLAQPPHQNELDPSCRCADLDSDGDMDLADFAAFSDGFGG